MKIEGLIPKRMYLFTLDHESKDNSSSFDRKSQNLRREIVNHKINKYTEGNNQSN